LVLGGLGALWRLASQVQKSSSIPGPSRAGRRFAYWALAAGVVLPLAGLFVEVAGAPPERQRRLGLLLLIGTGLKLLGLAIGAALGVYGVQIMDPRPSSVVVMSLRLVGEAAVLYGLAALARDLLRTRAA
jgi:putative copper export protein